MVSTALVRKAPGGPWGPGGLVMIWYVGFTF
jgi:hypothetical protein